MRKTAPQVIFVVTLGLCLMTGCCEQPKLPPGAVLMSEETAAHLAEVCRVSNQNTEQELLLTAIVEYLKDLHLKPGEDRGDCRIRRDERCRITAVSCAPRQTAAQAPAHCRSVLAGPPPEDERPMALPCGCGGSKRARKYRLFDFDNYSLTELDRIVIDAHATSRAQALAMAIAHFGETWRQRIQSPDFANSPGSRPRLRAPGTPCPPSIHYERMKSRTVGTDAAAK